MNANDLKVSIVKVPSYLSCLLNNFDENIILIHKAPSFSESFVYEEKSSDNNEDENLLDITGSPLKVNLKNTSFFSMESDHICLTLWERNEEKHNPISYEEAQKYIQEYWYKNYKNKNPLFVCCVCDGTNEKNVVLFLAKQAPNYITRILVSVEGYLPKNHPSISFEAMCSKHFQQVAEITGENKRIPLIQLITEVSNVYQLTGSKIVSVDFDENSTIVGSAYLEIKWKQCCAEIPLDHSTCTMTVQTVVGQKNSPLFRFWEELILLELYLKALIDYTSEKMLDNHWLPSLGDCPADLIDQIIEIIDSGQSEPRDRQDEDGLELLEIIENIDKRCTFDLTDQLWMILKKCTTYGALTDCLNVVFSKIVDNENYIYIADSNTTCMAQLIRDMKAGKTPVFRLKGTQPIELMIDIGLEKLRKDFAHIFTQFRINMREISKFVQNEEVADSEQIRSALYHKKSLLTAENVDHRMKLLGQFHTVVETFILVPTIWQKLSAKKIFHYYVGNDSPFNSFSDLAKNKFYETQVDLSIMEIYEYIKTLIPASKRLSLTLSRPFHSVQSVFHLSQQPIFPPIIHSYDITQEKNSDSEVYYYYTQLTQITNLIKTQLV